MSYFNHVQYQKQLQKAQQEFDNQLPSFYSNDHESLECEICGCLFRDNELDSDGVCNSDMCQERKTRI